MCTYAPSSAPIAPRHNNRGNAIVRTTTRCSNSGDFVRSLTSNNECCFEMARNGYTQMCTIARGWKCDIMREVYVRDDGARPSTGVGSVVTWMLGSLSRSRFSAGNCGALVLMGLS
jgi:hypothetical protein